MKFLILLILLPNLSWSHFPKDLSFQNDPRANLISIKSKEFKGMLDWVFVDGLGREVSFRGVNISSRAKSKRFNFLAFKNLTEAQFEINRFKGNLGGNLIRWVFNWSAIVPEPGKINFLYLDSQIAQIRLAIQYRIHILINIQQNLFGINSNGKYNGENGPPSWIYDSIKLPNGNCGKPCISITQNFVTNNRVRAAFNRFWNNAPLETPQGKKFFQDEFFLMMVTAMKYIKDRLTPFEWSFILGIDPINEPIPGDYEKGENYFLWASNKLFPFYQKVRLSLNSQGMADKLIFAESPTFWAMRITMAYKPTGPLPLTAPLGPGFVFNAHRFDRLQESFGLRHGENGIYLKTMDLLRIESRKMAAPPLLTEYGLWNLGNRKNFIDPQQLLKADFQAMEMSTPSQTFANFYSPLISGTQWSWDRLGYNPTYFGHGFSSNKPHYEDLGHKAIERAYPRRIQGDLMHFYYNDGAKDLFKLKQMEWIGIKTEDQKDSKDKQVLFAKNKFVFMVTRGKYSTAPSEIFLPRNFDISKTVLITDEEVTEKPKVLADFPQGGNQLLINSETDSPYHFALVLELGPDDKLTSKEFEELRQKIADRVNQEKSPLLKL